MSEPNPTSKGNPPGAKPAKPATPQPKPQRDPARRQPEEAAVGSGSATGFVSMLAKRQVGGGGGGDNDSLSATHDDARRSRENLPMAREIHLPAEQPPPPPPATPAKSPAPIPLWHRFMFILTWLFALAFLAIGTWAAGALLYMHNVSPAAPHDVHYPLIRWTLPTGSAVGTYTQASRIMAWSMLLCFPVALMLVIMSRMIRRRVRT